MGVFVTLTLSVKGEFYLSKSNFIIEEKTIMKMNVNMRKINPNVV